MHGRRPRTAVRLADISRPQHVPAECSRICCAAENPVHVLQPKRFGLQRWWCQSETGAGRLKLLLRQKTGGLIPVCPRCLRACSLSFTQKVTCPGIVPRRPGVRWRSAGSWKHGTVDAAPSADTDPYTLVAGNAASVCCERTLRDFRRSVPPGRLPPGHATADGGKADRSA